MTLALLIFSSHAEDLFTGGEQIEEAALKRGHAVVKLYEPMLSFFDPPPSQGSFDSELTVEEGARGGLPLICHNGKPLPPIDVIISRPNYVAEPSLHSHATDLLQRAGFRVLNGSAAIALAKNKIAQHVFFEANNFPCPRWGIAQRSANALTIAQTLGFPVIVKIAFGTHGCGVFFAPDAKILRPIVEYLEVRDRNPIIIEEFVAEAQGKDLRIFLLGGEILAAMERTAPQDDVRANTSGGGHGSPVVLTDAERGLAIDVTKRAGLDIAGVDIIRSSRGPLLLEINSNPGFHELERVTHLDIAGAIVEYATKTKPTAL